MTWLALYVSSILSCIPVNIILSLSLLEETQRLCEMVIEYDSLVPELAYEKVLFFDFLFKGQDALDFLSNLREIAL